MKSIEHNRNFMKADFNKLDGIGTDQQNGVAQPPLQKPYDEGGVIIKLPDFDEGILTNNNLFKCIKERRSRRKFSSENISLKELSFLLWSTQGVQEIRGDNYATFRPVPSGGARHPFETYIFVNRVDGLKSGIYRYLAISHELLFIREVTDAEREINESVLNQKFAYQSAVVFYWSCVPYRSEWRYSIASHKVMLLDAGHICQNLYLGCEAIGCGTCAIAAYNQEKADALLGLDGKDEYVIYIAPVGKV